MLGKRNIRCPKKCCCGRAEEPEMPTAIAGPVRRCDLERDRLIRRMKSCIRMKRVVRDPMVLGVRGLPWMELEGGLCNCLAMRKMEEQATIATTAITTHPRLEALSAVTTLTATTTIALEETTRTITITPITMPETIGSKSVETNCSCPARTTWDENSNSKPRPTPWKRASYSCRAWSRRTWYCRELPIPRSAIWSRPRERLLPTMLVPAFGSPRTMCWPKFMPRGNNTPTAIFGPCRGIIGFKIFSGKLWMPPPRCCVCKKYKRITTRTIFTPH
mmetsp:Transcript_18182/g.39385  ORF Transcript_18182/g.39385 Transcript_18182/m.39385 type:complete len:275 (-) Transcript_18182:904-1728(-)